jgi:hypothetical protein
MEEKIYEVLRKHKLPLKKREELIADLLNLFSVSDSLPVACTMEDDKGELGWTRLNIKYAGEVITNLSKKVKAFENFIDSFNENYR